MATAYITWWRRCEGLIHTTLDGQFDIVCIHCRLLGMCSIDLGILNDGRHVS